MRAARNQALFREVNERVEDLANTWVLEELQLVCECADIGCVELIPMPLDEYERTRANVRTFVVKPDHIVPDIERPVFATKDYVIVKKVDVAGEVAEAAGLGETGRRVGTNSRYGSVDNVFPARRPDSP